MSVPTLSRREVEDLRSSIDKAIDRYVGHSHSELLATASSCLTHGYERRKIIDKFAAIVDSKKATKLAEKIIQLAEDAASANAKDSKRKRTHDSEEHHHKDSKKSKGDGSESNGKTKEGQTNGASDNIIPSAPQEGVGTQMTMLSADKIRLMMVTAQQQIQERKRALNVLRGDEESTKEIPNPLSANAPPIVMKPVLYSQPTTTVFSREDYEKQKRMAELQAKIQSKLSTINPNTDKPRPLILDREGRTVDQTGRQVQLTHVLPTLKANIRAKKREELKTQIGPGKDGREQEAAPWFDQRVLLKPSMRTKKALRFNEPGKFLQQAERIRMKAQLEKLQNEISQIARKTGISSATKLALLAPDAEELDDVPDTEWWDSVILMNAEEREVVAARTHSTILLANPSLDLDIDEHLLANIKEDAISNLVEHPTQLRPPCEPTKPIYMPVFLTKQERKKLRRQTRREAWKEEQEKVRLGLEAPAEPTLRISNLMRVLGTEAVQDPTMIEARVREQMAKRKLAHEQANAARKLTAEQRTQRKITKIKEDVTLGVHVAVYRIADLFETASKKFKVEKNAQQLFMTGSVILHRGCCVVITEGGPKQHSKYKRLMMRRIKWEEDTVKDQDGQPVPNKCELVWEGTVQHRHFGEMKFKVCPTERAAREHLAKHGVPHYWDLAISKAILQYEE